MHYQGMHQSGKIFSVQEQPQLAHWPKHLKSTPGHCCQPYYPAGIHKLQTCSFRRSATLFRTGVNYFLGQTLSPPLLSGLHFNLLAFIHSKTALFIVSTASLESAGGAYCWQLSQISGWILPVALQMMKSMGDKNFRESHRLRGRVAFPQHHTLKWCSQRWFYV